MKGSDMPTDETMIKVLEDGESERDARAEIEADGCEIVRVDRIIKTVISYVKKEVVVPLEPEPIPQAESGPVTFGIGYEFAPESSGE